MIEQDRVKIPPYPAVAFRIRQTIDAGKFGLSDLAQITSMDQALAATVLRLANSAYFGRGDQVTSLSDAVSRIGAEELARVALALSLGGAVGQRGPLAELRRGAWRMALASALICQVLGRRRRLDVQQAFMCGLLHDFGRVVAVACLEEVVRNEPAEAGLPEGAWREMVDRLHVPLGAMVAGRWNLPQLLTAVISYHHEPEQAGVHRGMVDLVTVSDLVAALLDDCPYLLPRDLAQVPGMGGAGEIDELTRVVPFIPRYISDLDEVVPVAGPAVASRIAKPETLLEGKTKAAGYPVTWTRSNGDSLYHAQLVTERGLRFSGGTLIHEGSVVRLRVDAEGTPIEVSGRVLLCTPLERGYAIEVRLFALPGTAHDAWKELYDRLP